MVYQGYCSVSAVVLHILSCKSNSGTAQCCCAAGASCIASNIQEGERHSSLGIAFAVRRTGIDMYTNSLGALYIEPILLYNCRSTKYTSCTTYYKTVTATRGTDGTECIDIIDRVISTIVRYGTQQSQPYKTNCRCPCLRFVFSPKVGISLSYLVQQCNSTV